MANLKFYKSSNLPSSAEDGSVGFDPTNKAIKLKTSNGWETYGAANDKLYKASELSEYTSDDGGVTPAGVKKLADQKLSLSGGQMSGSIVFPYYARISQNQNDSSNWAMAIEWLKGGTGWTYTDSDGNEKKYSYQPGIGQHNTGGTGTGSISIVPYPTNNSPWEGKDGLYITEEVIRYKGKDIITSANISSQTVATATNVSSSGTASANVARHIWFSNESPETQRVVDDNFTYNPVGNIVTANISGNAATASSVAWDNVSGRPTIPTVGNGTITIKQTGKSDQTFTVNQSGNTTISLNDTNTDTKVTSVGNHYTPSGGTTLSASGGTVTDIANSSSGVQVITGITKDAAGHITGVSSVALKSTNTVTSIPEYVTKTRATSTAATITLALGKTTEVTLGKATTFTLPSAPTTDSAKLREVVLKIKVGSTVYSTTWPTGIAWANGEAPTLEASTYYEFNFSYNIDVWCCAYQAFKVV